MIDREKHVATTQQLLRWNPVVAILGARQVGKTTLAKQNAARWRGPISHFDLENPAHRTQLADPMLALESLRGLVVLDEPVVVYAGKNTHPLAKKVRAVPLRAVVEEIEPLTN